jgi:hypothetical protein
VELGGHQVRAQGLDGLVERELLAVDLHAGLVVDGRGDVGGAD